MPRRILIAEDEETTRDVLTRLAELHGYDVTAVTNGVDLLSLTDTERFDAVITDLMMKDLDGVAAANIMKMQGNTIPVIAITGISANDTHIFHDAFTRIYYKPVNATELFEYIESLIGK